MYVCIHLLACSPMESRKSFQVKLYKNKRTYLWWRGSTEGGQRTPFLSGHVGWRMTTACWFPVLWACVWLFCTRKKFQAWWGQLPETEDMVFATMLFFTRSTLPSRFVVSNLFGSEWCALSADVHVFQSFFLTLSSCPFRDIVGSFLVFIIVMGATWPLQSARP